MPNTNTYHLYIHADGLQQKDPVAGGKSKMTEAEKKQAKFEKALIGMVSYPSIKGTADKIINFGISQVNLTTGAAEYQQRLQATYNIASSAADTIYSTIMAGVIGGGWLAALNLAKEGLSALINIGQKQMELNNKSSLEDISINLSAIRAGARGGRGQN